MAGTVLKAGAWILMHPQPAYMQNLMTTVDHYVENPGSKTVFKNNNTHFNQIERLGHATVQIGRGANAH